MSSTLVRRTRFTLLAAMMSAAHAAAQGGGGGTGGSTGAPPPVNPQQGRGGGGRGFQGEMDSVRLRQLYVSNDHKDAPRANFAAQITAKNRTDSIWFARFKGVLTDYE